MDYSAKLEALGARAGFETDPLNPADLDEIEKEIGAALPTGYRSFVIACGGHQLRPHLYSLNFENADTPETVYVDAFLGRPRKGRPESLDLLRDNRDLLPRNLLPIARSAGGYICLVTNGVSQGQVYEWRDHGHRELPVDIGERGANEPNVFFMAESFDGFFEGLEAEEQYDVYLTTRKTVTVLLDRCCANMRSVSYRGSHTTRGRGIRVRIGEYTEESSAQMTDVIGLVPTLRMEFFMRVGGQTQLEDAIDEVATIIAAILTNVEGDLLTMDPAHWISMVSRKDGVIKFVDDNGKAANAASVARRIKSKLTCREG